MNHTAIELKRNHTDYLIINFCFNSHSQYFEEALKNNETIDKVFAENFFKTKILKFESRLEGQIYDQFVKSGKIYVIFDGLDEASSTHIEMMFKLIEAVSQMKYSGFFVSTRPEWGEKLQQSLNVPLHKLLKFTKQNQIDFLSKLWKDKNVSVEEIERYLDSLLATVIREASSFIETPLMLKMIAQTSIIENSQVKNEFSSITKLYEKFVQMEIERYFIKLNFDLSIEEVREVVEREGNRIKKLCENFSLKSILPEQFKALYPAKSREFEFNERKDMEKFGFVIWADSVKKEDGNFIHRTIGEYFAVTNLLKEKSPEEVYKILDDSRTVMRMFAEDFKKDKIADTAKINS